MKRENVWPWLLIIAFVAWVVWMNERARSRDEYLKATDPAAYQRLKEEERAEGLAAGPDNRD